MAPSTKQFRYNGPTRIGRQVPELMQKAYERFGFAYGQVLSHWAEIVGEDLADLTRPERIRWPRGARTQDTRKTGGTLIVRVDGPVALEVQHSTPQIIERINGYYGYGAIGEIKIVQGQVPRKERRAPPLPVTLDPESERLLDKRLAAISDPRLKATLSRLGRHIMFAKK